MATKTKSTIHAPKAKPAPSKNNLGAWILYNGVALIVLFILLTKVINVNPFYVWIKDAYLGGNMRLMNEYADLTNEERLQMKLGTDLNYIFYLRDNTPEDAVIYYPTAGDFRAGHPSMQQNPFNGKLCDKLTVVRFLYPRKVVVASEYGKTSWSKKITHVSVVNGLNKDKVPYQVGENFVTGVLPMVLPIQPSK